MKKKKPDKSKGERAEKEERRMKPERENRR